MHIRSKFLCFILILCMLLSLGFIVAVAENNAYIKTYLPGIVEAENYDVGENGSHSIDGVNSGKEYRPNDPMDIYSSSGKTYLQLNAGEFANYTVISEYDGIYNVYVDFIAEGELKLYIDGNETPIRALAQGSAGKTFFSAVRLRRGIHTFKITASAKAQFDNLIIESAKNEKVVFYPETDYLKEDNEAEIKNEVYKEFYVSLSGSDEFDGSKEKPFKTIKRAQEEVRKFNKNMTGDIYVYIEPGYHKLQETLKFTPEDGGTDKYNVIYIGTNPFSESVIGGGNLITGWERSSDALYKAHYDSPNDFRNLYINDVPAVRATTKYLYKPREYFKNEGSKFKYDGMKFECRNFPTEIKDAVRVEAVWNISKGNYRLPATSFKIAEKEALMEMKQPWFDMLTNDADISPVKNDSTVYFENDISFLDEPGEFYYDIKNKTVYYYPRTGEKLENVYACDTEYLINAEGTKENNIKNLHFERLSFKHGAFYGANDGYYNTQLSSGIKPLSAQLDFKHIKGLLIKDCKLIGLGVSAIGMTNGVTNSKIIGNLITDISGHAIMAGEAVDKVSNSYRSASDILIKNNVVRRVAREFYDCSAIHLAYAENITLTNNNIDEIGYTGLSIEEDYGGHKIAHNRLLNAVESNQGGAYIYMHSPESDTKIYKNYLKAANDNIDGISFYDKSSDIEIYENVVSVSGNWLLAQSSNITVYNNWHYSEKESIGKETVTTFGNKLEKDGAKDKWSADAQAVIDAAGVETPYKRLINEAELPDFAKGDFGDFPKAQYVPKSDWIAPGSYVAFNDIDASKPFVNSDGNIGNTQEGEWCEYDVDILESGTYKFSIKAGNGNKAKQPKVKLYIDGKVAEEDLLVPMWKENKWTTGEIEGQKYYLEEGVHRIRIEHKDGNFMFGPFKFMLDGLRTASDPEYDEGMLSMTEKEEIVFLDIANHWSCNFVVELHKEGIIKGISGTQFMPDREITLYEAILLMMRASGYDETKWREKLIDFKMTDYIDSVGKYVTREEFCNIIMKFYVDINGSYEYKADYNMYRDFKDISQKYILEVWGAKECGFMSGDENANFNPKKSLTRAEAAAVVLRYKNTVK